MCGIVEGKGILLLLSFKILLYAHAHLKHVTTSELLVSYIALHTSCRR